MASHERKFFDEIGKRQKRRRVGLREIDFSDSSSSMEMDKPILSIDPFNVISPQIAAVDNY